MAPASRYCPVDEAGLPGSGTLVPVTSTPPAAADPTPSRSTGRRTRGQGWLVVLGLMTAVPAVAATWLRVVPPSSERLAKVASFIPYGLIFWLPAVLLIGIAAARALRHRSPGRRVLVPLALLCVSGLVASAIWQGSAFVADRRPALTEPLTVTSINVAVRADPVAAAKAVTGADVAVFVEAQAEWVASLPQAFRTAFPYQAPAVGSEGAVGSDTVIFSKYPIVASEALPPSNFQQWSAVVRTPQLGQVRVVAVHPCNPYCRPGLWVQDATQLRGWLASHRDTMPMIVAGDFNAVDDHLTMQNLYADGFRSAAALAGAGFVRTWPADRSFPPLIAIDHVLVTPDLTATSFGTFRVPGTDHLGVRAVLAGVGD